MVIKEKGEILFYRRRGKYGFLSNMYLCPVKIDGKTYKSVEHYYQSRKAKRKEVRDWIADAPLAFFASKAGRALREKDMINNWDKKRIKLMREGLYAKFSQNRNLKEKLLKTGTASLHEDSPSDLFWGILGEDNLGKLLIELRGRLRKNALT